MTAHSTGGRSSDSVGIAFEAGIIAASAVVGVWLGEGESMRRSVGTAASIAAVALIAGWRYDSKKGPSPLGIARHVAFIALCLIVAGVGASRSSAEWRAVEKVRTGVHSGSARLVGEARAVGRGHRVVLEIDGQRFETWVFGSKGHRMQLLRFGDVVDVEGVRRGFDTEFGRRSQLRHIVGRFDMTDVRTAIDAERRTPPLVRAANRMRGMLHEGAQHLPAERAALFTGLVYGDDSAQSGEMIARFRTSGLAHLTAVSGQNVVYVLTMASPLLSRLRRPTRIGITVIMLTWFAIMTRLEPSVVRAVVMAGVAAVMVGMGRPVSSWVTLCATVVLVTSIDPFLVWSIGWWLSVAGCAGLILLTPAITEALSRRAETRGMPPRATTWMAPTIAAQTGVLGAVVAVFGWPSAWAIPCNLMAAPVAGLVMLVGMPLGLAAGFLPSAVSSLVMGPIGWAVAWVDGVAAVGSRLDPPVAVDIVVSLGCACAAVWARWSFRNRMSGKV